MGIVPGVRRRSYEITTQNAVVVGRAAHHEMAGIGWLLCSPRQPALGAVSIHGDGLSGSLLGALDPVGIRFGAWFRTHWLATVVWQQHR